MKARIGSDHCPLILNTREQGGPDLDTFSLMSSGYIERGSMLDGPSLRMSKITHWITGKGASNP